jgi:methylmalonyl-CoA mutase, C-terminal domain
MNEHQQTAAGHFKGDNGAHARPPRVLIAKAGLDGHDRGALVVAYALRDAGMEVIYTGRHQRPEQIVEAALQEDVDVIGISSLSDAHRTICPTIVQLMKERRMDDVLLVLGGFVPEEDINELKAAGVAEVFGPGTPLSDIVRFIRGHSRRL